MYATISSRSIGQGDDEEPTGQGSRAYGCYVCIYIGQKGKKKESGKGSK